MSPNPLRNLPSVHEILENPALKSLLDRINQNAVVSMVRTVLEEVGHEVQTIAADRTLPSVSDLAERIARRIAEGQSPHLRPVVNATGALFGGPWQQTPLADEAIADMAAVARDYACLDRQLPPNQPTRRDAAAQELLRELTGAEAALVLNSRASATLAVVAALAAGREVVVARNQIVEIGDDCRLPDLIAAARATLREIGSANKVRIDDYADAVGDAAGAVMCVQSGDFTSIGNVESVALDDLITLARRRQVPIIHNLAYGALIDLGQFNLSSEPVVGGSLKAGADVVLFCGSALVGGPACGIVLGRKSLLEQIERHALARATCADSFTLAALTATLRLYRDPEQARLRIPLLRLLTTSLDNLKNRAERLTPQIAAAAAVAEAQAVADTSQLGWGEPAPRELPTWCIAVRPAAMSVDRFMDALRDGTPSIIARRREDRVIFDLRTVPARQDMSLVASIEALGPPGAGDEPPEHR